MSRIPRPPATLVGKVFQAHAAIERGLITRHDLRSSAWRRLFRGVYADQTVADNHRIRCIAAAAFVLPKEAVVAGRSAVALYGAGLAEASDPIEVLIPRGQRFGPSGRFVIHTSDLREGETRRMAGVAVTDPVRTCWDLAQWLEPPEAVVLIDRLLAARLVNHVGLEAYAQCRRRERGWRRFARAVRLADARAGSPQESRLRVRLAMRGLAAPEVQYSVYGQWGFVARVDLAWPDLKIAVEYDGVWHAGSQQQIHHDRKRLNRLLASGWIVIHVTAARLRDDLDGIVAEIQVAMRARKAL